MEIIFIALFILKIIVDLLELDAFKTGLDLSFILGLIKCSSSVAEILHEFSLHRQESLILLVPKGFDWNSAEGALILHKVVHIDIIDVELGIWNPDRWEWLLISQDAKLLSVSVETNVFDFSE